MSARNRVEGEFGLRRDSQLGGVDLAVACCMTLMLFVAGHWLLTSYFAIRLDYRAVLGPPIGRFGDTPMYAPWSWMRWRAAVARHYPNSDLVATTEHAHSFILGLSLLGGVILLGERRRHAGNRAAELRGSAHWATSREVARTGLLGQEQGVLLGMWFDPLRRRLRLLRHHGAEHRLVVAPPRRGKDVGPIVSTLLTWKGSVVVIDPKAESWNLTSAYRHHIGHRVIRFEPSAQAGTVSRYNPLAAIRLRTYREIADAQQIASSWIDRDGKRFESENGVFSQSARPLLAGAFLHVLYRAEREGKPPAGLDEVIREFWHPSRSIKEILKEWQDYPHDPDHKCEWLTPEGERTKTHPMVAAAASGFLTLDTRTRSSILFSLRAALEVLQDSNLAGNLSQSDFQISDIANADSPTSLYLVYPPAERQRLGPVIRTILEQIIYRHLEHIHVEDGVPGGPHRHELLLVLNEFPLIGRMEALEAALPVCGAFGVTALLAAQDFQQIRAVYGVNETITSQMDVRVLYAPNRPETARDISDMLGHATILKRARSASSNAGGSGSSESAYEERRRLIEPDEVMRLPGPRKDRSGTRIVEPGTVIIVMTGHAPILGKQLLYWEDPFLRERAAMGPAEPANVEFPEGAKLRENMDPQDLRVGEKDREEIPV